MYKYKYKMQIRIIFTNKISTQDQPVDRGDF